MWLWSVSGRRLLPFRITLSLASMDSLARCPVPQPHLTKTVSSSQGDCPKPEPSSPFWSSRKVFI